MVTVLLGILVSATLRKSLVHLIQDVSGLLLEKQLSQSWDECTSEMVIVGFIIIPYFTLVTFIFVYMEVQFSCNHIVVGPPNQGFDRDIT